MGDVTFKNLDGTEKTVTVDDNTEAIVLSNKEVAAAMGRLAAALRARLR